jgi:hypothetical protein
MEPEPVFVTLKALVAMFGLSASTFYRLRRAGSVRTTRVGGRTLWEVASVRELFARQHEPSADDNPEG